MGPVHRMHGVLPSADAQGTLQQNRRHPPLEAAEPWQAMGVCSRCFPRMVAPRGLLDVTSGNALPG